MKDLRSFESYCYCQSCIVVNNGFSSDDGDHCCCRSVYVIRSLRNPVRR